MGTDEKDFSSSRSGGCMPSILQLFGIDPRKVFHHRRRISSIFLPRSFRVCNSSGEEMGLWRRRNSLESVNQDENMEFPMGLGIRIKTAKEESSSNSPAVRTPNLVAKLMGLDMISEANSNSNSPFSCYTPRTKSQLGDLLFIEPSRYSIDVVPSASEKRSERHFQRFSLDIHREKENADIKELRVSGCKNTVKSCNSRRTSLSDITNLNREEVEKRFNGKSNSKSTSSRDSYCYDSQRIFRPLKSANQQQSTIKKKSEGTRNLSEMKKKKRPNNKNMTKEPFSQSASRSKAKNTHLRNEVLIVGSSPKRVPATKVPQKQVAEHAQTKDNNQTWSSSKTSHSHQELLRDSKHLPTSPKTVLPEEITGGAANSAAGTAAEYKYYIQRILKRGGFAQRASFTSTNWHNSLHPLDPSVFNYLELFHPNAHASCALRRRCDRKLIFQLVDEILKEILEPRWESKKWAVIPYRGDINPDLIDEIWKKIEKFPAANCKFIEDIEGLIHRDLKAQAPPNAYLEEEANRLVAEIEAQIVGMLLHEMVEEVAAVVVASKSHVRATCPL